MKEDSSRLLSNIAVLLLSSGFRFHRCKQAKAAYLLSTIKQTPEANYCMSQDWPALLSTP